MTINELVDIIRSDKNCEVRQTNQTIQLPTDLPEDLKLFYNLTNGISLFPDEPYGINIVDRTGFQRANPIIIRENCEDDISFDWFVVGHAPELIQYISIDLAKPRIGKCYDSFWETHGLVGDTPIIANNFTDLLTQLYNNRGQYWYWLQPDFKKMGDAYDGENS